jgi:hypothetical protein
MLWKRIVFSFLQDGETPLHFAFGEDSTEVCMMLLEKDADPKAADKVCGEF